MEKRTLQLILLIIFAFFTAILWFGLLFYDRIIEKVLKIRKRIKNMGFGFNAIVITIVYLPFVIPLYRISEYGLLLFVFMGLVIQAYAFMLYEFKSINMSKFEYMNCDYKKVRKELFDKGFKHIECVGEIDPMGDEQNRTNTVSRITFDDVDFIDCEKKDFRPNVDILIYYYKRQRK